MSKAPAMISPYITDSAIESAVAVVLVGSGNVRNAMTVSCFSEVAHHPTAIWVAISPTTFTHHLLEEIHEFSIAVLNERQAELARLCGSVSGRDSDKCANLDLYTSPSGFPFLRGALSSTACKLRHNEAVGDHTIFIADVVEAELDSRTLHLRQLLISDLRS